MKEDLPQTQESNLLNLLSNFESTVELIKKIEGEAWYRNTIKDVNAIVERLKKLEPKPGPNVVVGSFYGDGGVTRWMIMGNGKVKFSASHDTVGEKIKTKKAQEFGFELI